ncbi:MAG: pur operon repressor [Firmicutes bacterium]|jgi:purine operon repressor|nr:pur operon repressor [Bacillota bacterium]NLL87329.1 pur operon repressor [Bacillota bacterium]
MRRSHRIAVIAKTLTQRPYHLFSLTDFARMFGAAKSSLSEDLAVIKAAFADMGMGKIETLPGAAGGVRYVPKISGTELFTRINRLCRKLSDPGRILPGGFIYLNDLTSDPVVIDEIGEIFAAYFAAAAPQYIVTVETSGIPLAMATAHYLNVPMVVVRRISQAVDGSVVTVNYLSGSSQRIQTMSLARRALPEGSRVLLVDDFMRAGGTLRGLTELMAEFESDVVGMGILIETKRPAAKLVKDYVSFICLEEIDPANQSVQAVPAAWIKP